MIDFLWMVFNSTAFHILLGFWVFGRICQTISDALVPSHVQGIASTAAPAVMAAQEEWKPNWDYDDLSPQRKDQHLSLINPVTGLPMVDGIDSLGYSSGDGPREDSSWDHAHSTFDSFMDTHSMDMSSMDTYSTFDSSSTFDSFSSTDSFSDMHSYD